MFVEAHLRYILYASGVRPRLPSPHSECHSYKGSVTGQIEVFIWGSDVEESKIG